MPLISACPAVCVHTWKQPARTSTRVASYYGNALGCPRLSQRAQLPRKGPEGVAIAR